VLKEAGHDATAVLAKASSQEIKDELRKRTDEAVARGVFGVPAFFVNGENEPYWGQDRMSFVEEALGGAASPLAPVLKAGEKIKAVDFWFDYSSPFTYIASERVEAYFGEHARWRPMLLGGLFKTIGQVDVPLLAMSDNKRRYMMSDLMRQSKRANIPFHFPSKFPMNTVLPLRATLAAEVIGAPPAKTRAFVHNVFRAFWGEDRDISDAAVIKELADRAGLDGAELALRASDQAVKDKLRANTDEAAAIGVFGAPTFALSSGGAEPALYWGADRLELAARAARKG
jgi:2-hydroxychromene-2-carboxylate isomerase